jgi:hypothetical protein
MPRRVLVTVLAFVLFAAALKAQEQRWPSIRRSPRLAEERTIRTGSVDDLTGRWLMTLPAGFQYLAKIERSDDGAGYRLYCPAANLQGEYIVREGRRFTIRPEDLPLAGLTWDIKNANLLVLTEQPIPSPVGADYRGAVLVRIDGIDFGE